MVSEREIEEAIKAFQIAHTAKVDIPLEQSMRDALEAAARVRAEADVGEPIAYHFRYEDPEHGAFEFFDTTPNPPQKFTSRQALYARPAPQPSGPVEALEAVIRDHDPRHAAIRGPVPMSVVTRAYDEFAADLREALSALTAGKPEREQSEEHRYAERLLLALTEKHYPDRSPEWAPLPDLMGILTQIDNITTGLVRTTPPTAGGGDE